MRTKYFLALTIAVLLGGGMLVFANPPAGSGSISGKITYTGTPPKMKPIDMSKEPICAKQHATPVMTENVATGPGNALAVGCRIHLGGRSGIVGALSGRAVRSEGLPISSSRSSDADFTRAADLQRRPDLAQHSSACESEFRVEQVSTPRFAADRH